MRDGHHVHVSAYVVAKMKAFLKFFAIESEVAELNAAYRSATGAPKLRYGVALAWQLRQRDMPLAASLAAELRPLIPVFIDTAGERSALESRLWLVEGENSWLSAEFERAEQLADQALAAFTACGDEVGCADAYWLRAWLMVEYGYPERRDEAFQQARESAQRAGEPIRYEIATAALARWAVFSDLERAKLEWAQQIFSLPHRDDPAVAVWVDDFGDILAAQQGDFERAIAQRMPSYCLALWTGQLHRAIICAVNIGIDLNNLNDYENSLIWLQRAQDLAEKARWPTVAAVCMTNTANSLKQLGRIDAALALAKQAVAGFGKRTSSRAYSLTLQIWGEIQLAVGDYSGALQNFENIAEMSQRLAQADMSIVALRGKAQALSMQGQHSLALSAAEQSLALARERADAFNEVEALTVLAQIHMRIGTPNMVDGKTAALHYLEQCLQVAARVEGYSLPAGVFDAVATQFAELGQLDQAYHFSLQAKAARQKAQTTEAVNRAVAMQVSHQTEQARILAEHQREVAQAEAQRALLLEKTGETLERLGEIGREITAQLDVVALFETLSRHMHGLLDASHFSVYLLDETGKFLDLVFAVESGTMLPLLQVPLDDATSYAARCARDKAEIFLTQSALVARSDPNLIPGTVPTLSGLFAPLSVSGTLLGVISIQSPLADAYEERELLIFRSLCAYGAIAIDKARAYRRVAETLTTLRQTQSELMDQNALLEIAYRERKRSSLTDPLTGMHNRRYLVEQMEARLLATRAAAQSAPLPQERRTEGSGPGHNEPLLLFFMIDLDYFKLVNDRYGHAAGDQVLIQLRARLEQVARTGDYLIRWGGEEFLLVVKTFERANAPLIAERLRRAVAQRLFDLSAGVTIHKTCSIGFSSFPFSNDGQSDLTWSQVVDVADRALYLAKNEGRNRWAGLMAGAKSPVENLYYRISHQLDECIQAGDVIMLHKAAA